MDDVVLILVGELVSSPTKLVYLQIVLLLQHLLILLLLIIADPSLPVASLLCNDV